MESPWIQRGGLSIAQPGWARRRGRADRAAPTRRPAVRGRARDRRPRPPRRAARSSGGDRACVCWPSAPAYLARRGPLRAWAKGDCRELSPVAVLAPFSPLMPRRPGLVAAAFMVSCARAGKAERKPELAGHQLLDMNSRETAAGAGGVGGFRLVRRSCRDTGRAGLWAGKGGASPHEGVGVSPGPCAGAERTWHGADPPPPGLLRPPYKLPCKSQELEAGDH